jgi:hypothetical protein
LQLTDLTYLYFIYFFPFYFLQKDLNFKAKKLLKKAKVEDAEDLFKILKIKPNNIKNNDKNSPNPKIKIFKDYLLEKHFYY